MQARPDWDGYKFVAHADSQSKIRMPSGINIDYLWAFGTTPQEQQEATESGNIISLVSWFFIQKLMRWHTWNGKMHPHQQSRHIFSSVLFLIMFYTPLLSKIAYRSIDPSLSLCVLTLCDFTNAQCAKRRERRRGHLESIKLLENWEMVKILVSSRWN